MKNLNINLILGISILLLTISCKSSEVIFNENAKDWDAFGDANWYFSGNEFIGEIDDGIGFVMTQKTYKNFILELEFYPDNTINSGIFVRCKEKEINFNKCYEFNIWDLHPNQKNRTGAILTRTIPLAHVETINKWNTYKIKMQNNHIQVWVNGTLTADTIDDNLVEGYIGLQAEVTGKVKFRNIKIKNLDDK